MPVGGNVYRPYVLHKHPMQIDTLRIVRWLHHHGIPMLPTRCVERNHPAWVRELPAIETRSERYVGLDACIAFYEECSGVGNLREVTTMEALDGEGSRVHTSTPHT